MPAVEDLEICTLMGLFCPKDIKIFKWKSTEELCLITLKSDGKFEEKTDSWFQKWHEEFGEF